MEKGYLMLNTIIAMFYRLFSSVGTTVCILLTTLIALVGHELAHGWVSGKLGDPTPKMQGRMTLNPLAHLDLVGTLLMLLTGFGWAKPVQVNPMYYKNRKKGMALVALAGPLANLLMAFAGFLLGTLLGKLVSGFSYSAAVFIMQLTALFTIRNLQFMVFNLIPLPPLDGAKILGVFLPDRAYYTMLQYEQYCIIILMVLSLLGVFGNIIGAGVSVFYSMIARVAFRILGIGAFGLV